MSFKNNRMQFLNSIAFLINILHFSFVCLVLICKQLVRYLFAFFQFKQKTTICFQTAILTNYLLVFMFNYLSLLFNFITNLAKQINCWRCSYFRINVYYLIKFLNILRHLIVSLHITSCFIPYIPCFIVYHKVRVIFLL